jgi:hypothetical protein
LDFAFAYGTAKLVSTGNFSLTRIDDKVTVEGKISHNFIDRYDWELGLSVIIAGEVVKDEDMKFMEIYKGAKPFDVNCTSTETVSKVIDV